MKGNKGITLIALVITIIVLLILAGVSIAMLSGDNSILGNASKSADANKIGEIEDEISMKVSEYVMAYLDKTYNNTAYTDEQNAVLGADTVTTPEAAVLATLQTFATKYNNNPKVAYKAPSGDTEGYIDITSNGYYVTGTVTSKGVVTWGTITKGTAPTRS